MAKLDFEQRHRANEMLERLANEDDLEEFVFEFIATKDAYNKLRQDANASKRIAIAPGIITIPSQNGNEVTISVDMLREVMDRFNAVCVLSTRLCNEIEDRPDAAAREFDIDELKHHIISDYSCEIRQELHDLVDGLNEASGGGDAERQRAGQKKHDAFIDWARDNYGHEGTMEFTSVTDHYVLSGEFPEEFERFFAEQEELYHPKQMRMPRLKG
jgi:vacuolar-type H+-ATPase subunit F/Vma7